MNRLSLKARIYIAAASLIVVLAINACLILNGQSELALSMDRMRQVSHTHANALTIDRDVQELKRRVDQFVVSGHESVVDETRDIRRRLRERIDSLRRPGPSDDTDRLRLIQEHLDEYARQFESVVRERTIQKSLVQSQLPQAGNEVDRAIKSLNHSVADQSSRQRLAISLADSSFSNAEKMILRYFENPDSTLVEQSLNAIDQSRNNLSSLPESGQDVEEAFELIDRFQRIALRAVQATRSYLLLRNVVMAGEASEIAYHSEALRVSAEQTQNRIMAEVAATGRRVRWTTVVSILIAGLATVLVAARLVVAIIPPIASLTQTFGKLSAGHTLRDIAGTCREDEIGQMAKAARIFSDQNLKTRELLSESERLNHALTIQKRELEATNDELDSFAYVASHDLKSPLRGIRQLATWIEEDSVDELSETTRGYLDNMVNRVTRMDQLLDDLLEFSRVGRITPPCEQVDVAELLADVVAMTDNPADVKIEWTEDMPTLSTPRPPLEQVFMNLIGNAIKHNDRGDHGKVVVSGRKIGERFQFTVADNGPGIDRKHHERAFQMYQRVGEARVEGSGMGLAIVKKQVESFGGTIELESEIGKGASFTFSWPLTVEPRSQELSHA